MRFNINLASRPYENARRFFLEWGIALTIAFVLTGVLVFAAARSWSSSHALARSIAAERSRLDKLNQQEKADLAILNRPENQDVRATSEALNALIVRKSVSWTRIFNDLEKMMPTHLHVVSITPQLSATNELQIRMVVAGDSRDKAIELVENMEKAPDFRRPQIVSEATAERTKGQTADLVTFSIVTQYTPAITEAQPNKSAANTGEEGLGKPAAKASEGKPVSPSKPATQASNQGPKGGTR